MSRVPVMQSLFANDISNLDCFQWDITALDQTLDKSSEPNLAMLASSVNVG